jgi:regulator-associated protein of mTOR
MWAAWDLALDLCLTQLPSVLEEIHANQVISGLGNGSNGATNGNNTINVETIVTNHTPSPFFEEQLTAFQVWLEYGSETREPPEQLPIVLQVLLSQVPRVRALELLGRYDQYFILIE